MKNVKLILLVLLILVASITGCSKKAVEEDNTNYIDSKTLKESLESDKNEYVLLDVRKLEDHKKAHIKTSVDADVHAANKEGNDEKGIEHLKAALLKTDGNELGSKDKKYVLICYSGNSYAKKANELLISMGLDKSQLFTLKGGMKGWQESGDEYKALLE